MNFLMSSRFLLGRAAVSAIYLSLTLAGCGPSSLQILDLDVAGHELTVEVADTQETRNQGLMDQKSLEENTGMLFVFENESRVSFWMKDTDIPLSIAFIAADGTIRQIEDMEPESLASVSSSRNVLYALEVNQGWFNQNGIVVGDRVDISALRGNP